MGRKQSKGLLCPFLGRGRGMVRGLPSYYVASWSTQQFGHNRHGPKIEGLCSLFGEGAMGPHVTQCRLGWEAYLPTKWHLDPSSHWPQKIWAENWGLCLFGEGEQGPHLIRCGQGRAHLHASFILIHPTVWPQYTNVTDRQDRTDNSLIS